MKWTESILAVLGLFLVQLFLVDLTTIRMVRPDFIAIGVFYIALKSGRFNGVLVGFMLGLLVDLVGVGSYFGLSPLTCSITGYLGGYLQGKYERFIPFHFYALSVGIFGLHFLIFTYIRYQTIFESDLSAFWNKWMFTTFYTLVVVFIVNFFYPLREAARAQS